jgi:probable F420-dependent oxidoreductase
LGGAGNGRRPFALRGAKWKYRRDVSFQEIAMDVGLSIFSTASFNAEVVKFFATKGEEFGYHSLWMPEHVSFPVGFKSKYPYTPDGSFPGDINLDTPEPISVLNYAAALTRRIKLGTSIVILPLHHPLYIGKQLATLDVLSGGRTILGVGSGWLKEEFDALGLDFKTRGRRTDEAIEALRAIWRDNPSEYHGKHFNFDPIKSFPKPVRGSIPIVIGGHSPANAKRAARLGDGLMPGSTIELAAHAYAMMKEECARIGRNPAEIEFACAAEKDVWLGGCDKLGESARRARDIGAVRVGAPTTMFGLEWNPDAIARAMEKVANEVIAKIN